MNTEMVIKRGVRIFWWWLCSKVLLCVERPQEKFDKQFRSLKAPHKGTGVVDNAPNMSFVLHCHQRFLRIVFDFSTVTST